VEIFFVAAVAAGFMRFSEAAGEESQSGSGVPAPFDA